MSENNRAGWGQMLASVLREPFERRLLREETARYERLSMDAASRMLEEVVRRVQPEDDEMSVLLKGREKERELDEMTAQELRDAALTAWLKRPHARGYLKSLKRFVMGTGPDFVPLVEDEGLRQRLDDQWKAFRRYNKWDTLEDEIAVRTWRDGEVFIRGFEHDMDGSATTDVTDDVAQRLMQLGASADDLEGEPIPAGMLLLRLVPPEQISDPMGTVSHGIITAAKDVQTVLGYIWRPDPSGQKAEVIPAREMRHIKINVDSDVKRGRSALEVLLKRMKQYEDWLEYRVILNLVRSSVTLIKKVEGGTPAQLAALRQAQQKQLEATDNERRARMLKPGTTVTAPAGIGYEFLSPKLDAQDAQHDGRTILLNMAAATGLPEYMFTGDASNANFASTMVAESPAVREFQDWQDFLTSEYSAIWRWAIKTAAKHGAIEGLSEEQADELEVEVNWPPMMARNRLDDVKADDVLVANKALSREGMARRAGLNWEEEKARIDEERQQAMEFLPPPMRPGDTGGEED